MTGLQEVLDGLTTRGTLCELEGGGVLHCTACAHRCRIRPGQRGICRVRYNQDGVLRVPWGYVAALQNDPIEKKPLAHFLPGAAALTFGMLGCNFHCDFCQNWLTSQPLRDSHIGLGSEIIHRITPEGVLSIAHRVGAQVIASSYNEPLITSEWAVDIFRLAQAEGLRCVYISNGSATPEALRYLRPHLDGYKIDLKSMRDASYRAMGGRLQQVLDSIRLAHDLGLWVEVVTLVIPGFNDSLQELWDAARYLASVSADIPWHVTAYHPDYRMMDPPPTPSDTLQRAAEIGQEAGLHYVYAGNLPGRVGSLEDTFCPHCQTRLIQRRGFRVLAYAITADGKCPRCAAPVAGVWARAA